MTTFTRVQHNTVASPGTTAASLTATLGAGVTSGNLLIATITIGTSVGTVTPPAGWAQAGPTETVTSALQTQIFYLVVGAGGAASFAFSWSGSHSFGWTIDEWNSSTGWLPSPADTPACAGAVHSTASTAVNCGSPSASAQASELWFGVLSYADSGLTYSGITAGWTTGDTSAWNTAGNNSNTSFYQTRTATGTPTLAATISASRTNAGVVTAFKANSAVTHSGTAGLSGSGTLSAAGADVKMSTAGFNGGQGALTATPLVTIFGAAAMAGTGTLSGSAQIGGGGADLMGSGTLSATLTVTWAEAGALVGSGALGLLPTGLQEQTAALTGTGALVISGEKFGYVIALVGSGILTIPQVVGGLVSGVGGAATPQALPGASQVAVAPQGSSNWQWIGTLGQVTALSYGFLFPGGCDQMSMTVMCPAAYRTQLFDPGWQVKIVRGGHQVWYGKLDEPQPTASGWTLTAVGAGNLGQNFVDYYSVDDVWPQDEPDEIINRAIIRGLPWSNPGLNGSPYSSQFWMGQATDPGSQTVAAFLNLICTRGGLAWYVNSQPGGAYNANSLAVLPLPTTPNRLLVCTTPVARTLGGYINSIVIRYMATADNTTTNVPAAYNVVNALNQPSIAAHGVMETYIDLSDVGVMASSAALAVGYSVLSIYQAASYAGPFTVGYGQLLNSGGQAIDPGTDQAGTVARLILTDFGYGGEVVPGPVTFIVGAYSWDDFAQTATVTPYQAPDQSLTGLLQTQNTLLTPITAASVP